MSGAVVLGADRQKPVDRQTPVDRWTQQVRELTGFDADTVNPGSAIVVAGVGPGVADVVAACAAMAPDLPIAPWSTTTVSGANPAGANPTSGVGVMVIDPAADIDDHDITLFTQLWTEHGTVALVCTGIDAFWEWPRRLRAARAVLDPEQHVPVFAVSSAAALAGAADESGIDELLAWLRAVRAEPDALRIERARIGACVAALDEACRAADGREPEGLDPEELNPEALNPKALNPKALNPERLDPEELVRRRRILVATRDRGRTDRLAAVRSGMAGVRVASVADVQAGMRALAAASMTRCAQGGPDELAAHPQWLATEIERIGERVEAVTNDRLDEVAATALLGVDGVDAERVVPSISQPVMAHRPPPTGRRGAEDALLMLLGASTGVGIGRLAVVPMASVHTLQWISMPLTLVLGVAVAAWVIRVRRAAVRRGDLRGWSGEVLAEARGRCEQRVVARVAAAESRVAGQITRHHDRRVRQVAADVAEIDGQLHALRNPRADPAGHEHLRRLRDEVAARLRELPRTETRHPAPTHPAPTETLPTKTLPTPTQN